jgi:hypothetical protein
MLGQVGIPSGKPIGELLETVIMQHLVATPSCLLMLCCWWWWILFMKTKLNFLGFIAIYYRRSLAWNIVCKASIINTIFFVVSTLRPTLNRPPLKYRHLVQINNQFRPAYLTWQYIPYISQPPKFHSLSRISGEKKKKKKKVYSFTQYPCWQRVDLCNCGYIWLVGR